LEKRHHASMVEEIAVKIAGDIVLSEHPGAAMRRWRRYFDISQSELAAKMGVKPSVISDYEIGRRRSPGASIVKRFVRSLIEIDQEKGGRTVLSLARLVIGASILQKAVLDMREFVKPVTIAEFCKAIDADLLTAQDSANELLLGYTVVDSITLVVEVPAHEYARLYGATTQRAAVFTGVKFGRSPLVAVKSMQAGLGGLRPALVVLHGLEKVDELGLAIARNEHIPLAITKIKRIEDLISRLSRLP